MRPASVTDMPLRAAIVRGVLACMVHQYPLQAEEAKRKEEEKQKETAPLVGDLQIPETVDPDHCESCERRGFKP